MRRLEHFRNRGQFLLGPAGFSQAIGFSQAKGFTQTKGFSQTAEWPTHLVHAGMVLTAHPDVPVCQVKDGEKSLTLIGHLLDPLAPDKSNSEILQRLCSSSWGREQLAEFPRLTDPLCGRWVIIASAGSDILLVHDAAGQRQVHYARHNGATYCASDPKAIAEHLGLARDPNAEQMRQCAREHLAETFGHQFWWPGDTTSYAEIRRLLPNHCLSMRSGEVRRYFGQEPVEGQSLDVAVPVAAKILRGALARAHKRCRLAIGCTAGWDSRVLMAASQQIRDDIFYYSCLGFSSSRNHPDIAVPRRLLTKRGLRHNIIKIPPVMSSAFANIYDTNVDTPHPHWGCWAEGMDRRLPPQTLVLSGTVSEVARRFYWADGDIDQISPKFLAQKTALTESPHTLAAFSAWLDDGPFGDGIHPLDIFYWEQRAGSWAATWHEENAIAFDTIPPFNCRALLTTLLSVDKQYRRYPDYELYRRLIEYLWPEGLSEPINPPKPPRSFSAAAVDRVGSGLRRLLPDSVVPLAKNAARNLRRLRRGV
jgi:hypothetical protein